MVKDTVYNRRGIRHVHIQVKNLIYFDHEPVAGKGFDTSDQPEACFIELLFRHYTDRLNVCCNQR